MERQMISAFKGLAPVSMPADWLKDFDVKNSFACVDSEARIRFPNKKAFGVRVYHSGHEVSRSVRLLSSEEIVATPWGAFSAPWESYQTASIFGHGPVTALDTVE